MYSVNQQLIEILKSIETNIVFSEKLTTNPFLSTQIPYCHEAVIGVDLLPNYEAFLDFSEYEHILSIKRRKMDYHTE